MPLSPQPANKPDCSSAWHVGEQGLCMTQLMHLTGITRADHDKTQALPLQARSK